MYRLGLNVANYVFSFQDSRANNVKVVLFVVILMQIFTKENLSNLYRINSSISLVILNVSSCYKGRRVWGLRS